MKYGVYLPNFGDFGDSNVLAQLAKDAEQAGWDGFFIWDHIAGWGEAMPFADPIVALSAIALNTTTIRLGALVTPLPRRRPHKVAREMVSLDHLSNGRLVFGAGIGGGQDEWDHLGEETDLKTRGEMLDEGLAILDGLWKGEPFSYTGKHYQIQNAHFQPTPCQSPRIPVWIGARWPHKAPLRRSMQWDGVFPIFEAEGEAEHALIKECMPYIRELRAGMSNPFEIVYAGCPTPGDDPARAAEIVRLYAGFGFTWWLELISPFGVPENETLLRVGQRRIRQGPPRFA